MADEKFGLPGSSYEELTKIIKAYGPFNEPVTLEEVSRLIGMDKTVISRNSSFLIEMGILEAGKKKMLTPNGKNLSQALEHDMPEEIRNEWRRIIRDNEFCSKLISAVKIRNGMDESTLQSHIAYSAGQPKRPQFMTGAKTVIDIFRASELLREEDGKYVISKDEVTTSREGQQEEASDENKETASFQETIKVSGDKVVSPASSINVNLDIRVECSLSDLDHLGEKVRKMVDDIEGRSENSEKDNQE